MENKKKQLLGGNDNEDSGEDDDDDGAYGSDSDDEYDDDEQVSDWSCEGQKKTKAIEHTHDFFKKNKLNYEQTIKQKLQEECFFCELSS